MNDTHIIGRQQFRIRLNTAKDAEYIYSRISDLTKNRLTSLVDELFTELSPPDQIVRIDQLVINIGTVSDHNFEEEIITQVLNGLREQLEKHLKEEAVVDQRTSPQQMKYELLAYFLAHGNWPWWAAENKELTSLSALLLEVLQDSPKRLSSLLASTLVKRQPFNRFRFQFSEVAMATVNARLFSQGWSVLAKDIDLLLELYRLAPFSTSRSLLYPKRSLIAIATRLIVSGRATNATVHELSAVIINQLALLQQVPSRDLRGHFLQTLRTVSSQHPRNWPKEQLERVRQQLTAGAESPQMGDSENKKTLQIILAYLRKGTLPANGPLRTAGAIEQRLVEWIKKDEVPFRKLLQQVLADQATSQRLHKKLRWPTLLAIHQWIWGRAWPTVSGYLADLEQLLVHLQTTAFTSDSLRRTLLDDWFRARLASQQRSSPPTTEVARKFWAKGIRAALLKLAREANRPLGELLTDSDLLKAIPKNTWQSDLPEIIAAIATEEQPETFADAVPAKSIGVFRFFLERGYLPEGHSKGGWVRLEADIYQKALTGNLALFSMLAKVLRNEQAFARFRRDVSLRLLYVLAYQLVRKEITDIGLDTEAELPFLPPSGEVTDKEAPKSNEPVSDLDTPTGEINKKTPQGSLEGQPPGSGLDQDEEKVEVDKEEQTGDSEATPLASPPPLHLRPRPDITATEAALAHSPRALFFAFLASLYPEAAWWKQGHSAFLRHSYALLIRHRLLERDSAITLSALVREWGQAIQRASEVTWPILADHLKKMSAQRDALPVSLRDALLTVAALTPDLKNPPLASPINEIPVPKGELQQATPIIDPLVKKWAAWLSGSLEESKKEAPPKKADFKHFVTISSTFRAQLIGLLAGKKIIPDRLLGLVSPKSVQQFTDRMIGEMPPGTLQWLQAIRQLLEQAGIYTDKAEATSQGNRYALMLTLGSNAVSPRQADRFTEQLLAMVAREHGLTTAALAGQLISTAKATTVPANLLLVLQRIHARLTPAETRKIKQATEQEHAIISKLDAKARSGKIYQSALTHQLETGESPWWETTDLPIDELFLRAVSADVDQLISTLAQKPVLARRLFPFLPDVLLQTFVEEAFGEYADFLVVWAEAVRSLHKKRLLSASSGPTMAWVSAWAFAMERKAFTSNSFLEHALKTTTAAYGIGQEKLINLLQEEVTLKVTLNDVRYYRLAALLEDKRQEPPTQSSLQDRDAENVARFIPSNILEQSPTASLADSGAGAGADKDTGKQAEKHTTGTSQDSGAHPAGEAGADAGASKDTGKQGKGKADTGISQKPQELPGTAAGKKEMTAHQDAEAVPAEEPAASPSSYAEVLDDEVRQLLHFLSYGTTLAGRPSPSREALLKLQERLIRLHPEVAGSLYRNALKDRVTRERVVRFFPDHLITGILKLLLGRRMAWAERLWADLARLLPGIVRIFSGPDFNTWAAIHLLSYPATHQASSNLSHYPAYLLEGIARRAGTTLEKLFLDLTEEIQSRPAGLAENWAQILDQIKEQKLLQATEGPTEKTHPMEDSLYIHNAGLVIMAPFFNRYFNMLEMLEGQAFKDEETAIRGVQLLEYLASGRTEVAEHELVFNKVLCGLPISTPVPGEIELTEHEVEISSQMQNAVLQNWEKMSTSTVENLQGSFILRNGLLLEQAEHWSLQVESAGYDVLLSFLPWTISIVSLPWVDKRLEVDWKTNI